MINVNLIMITGIPTAEPKVLPSGKVATFSIARNRCTKKKDGTFDVKAQFIDVKVFGTLIQKAQMYVKKCEWVHITGSLDQDDWTDKETQKPRSKQIIIAHDIQAGKEHKATEPTAPTQQPDFMQSPLPEPPPQNQLPPKRPQPEQDEGRVIYSSERDNPHRKTSAPAPMPNGGVWTPPITGEPPF